MALVEHAQVRQMTAMHEATTGERRRGGLGAWLDDLGTLRIALCAVVVALIAAAPFSGGQARFEGLAFVVTVLAPALFVMFVFILALDLVMTRVFLVDAEGDARRRLVRVLRVEGVLFAGLLLAWTPLVIRLLALRQG